MPKSPQTPSIRPEKRKRFQTLLLAWYAQYARDLPWRKTNDPYHIVVSEMMLQQTQVDRVQEKYAQWLEAFPTVHVLAAAPAGKVIAAWQGLGYNRRALYLQRTAQEVVNTYNGVFPHTREELLALPGIGPYTAGAIMSFAFHKDEPIVDTNVRRVIGRIFMGYTQMGAFSEDALWQVSTRLLPKKGKAYYFNQALMDFGAMICINRRPKCEICPMKKICRSYPAIQDAPAAELRLKKVNETLYFGKPKRIWRGKILQYLHTVHPRGATYMEIGRVIQADFSKDRLPWLRTVIDALLNDALIVQKGKRLHTRDK